MPLVAGGGGGAEQGGAGGPGDRIIPFKNAKNGGRMRLLLLFEIKKNSSETITLRRKCF